MDRMILTASIALVGAVATGCNAPVDRDAHKAFMGALGNTSITVFPAYVRHHGKANSHEDAAAPLIGQFLADEGVATATISEEHVPLAGPWHANQAKMLEESAEAFIAYLAEHPVTTDYALLPEYLFRGKRPGGIHCHIVDAQNRWTFAVLLNSHWEEFIEMKPQTVDDCTPVLIEALRRRLVNHKSGG